MKNLQVFCVAAALFILAGCTPDRTLDESTPTWPDRHAAQPPQVKEPPNLSPDLL